MHDNSRAVRRWTRRQYFTTTVASPSILCMAHYVAHSAKQYDLTQTSASLCSWTLQVGRKVCETVVLVLVALSRLSHRSY